MADFLLAFVLAAAMGDDEFSVRVKATDRLRDMDLIALPALRMAVKSPDCEIRHRAAMLIDDCLSVFPTKRKLLPWLAMLPQDWPNRQQAIDDGIAELRGGYSGWAIEFGESCRHPDWGDWRDATALFIARLREKGWSRDKCRGLLDKMVVMEDGYRKRHGQNPLIEIDP